MRKRWSPASEAERVIYHFLVLLFRFFSLCRGTWRSCAVNSGGSDVCFSVFLMVSYCLSTFAGFSMFLEEFSPFWFTFNIITHFTFSQIVGGICWNPILFKKKNPKSFGHFWKRFPTSSFVMLLFFCFLCVLLRKGWIVVPEEVDVFLQQKSVQSGELRKKSAGNLQLTVFFIFCTLPWCISPLMTGYLNQILLGVARVN